MLQCKQDMDVSVMLKKLMATVNTASGSNHRMASSP